jgi:D-3-phosphoglycerate dehydrogenase / 2-oxoglutarate reductase
MGAAPLPRGIVPTDLLIISPALMKIVIADDLPVSAADLLREVPEWTVDARAGRPLSELEAALSDADALIVRSATKVTRALIEKAPRLRVIARAGSGVDNVDLDAASGRGIVVMNAPGANSISVAELAVAFLLALARPIPAADAAMKTQTWEKKKFSGTELRGKTLGLVGLARIGQEVAARARSFGMNLIAHDPFISADVAAQVGARLASLDDVCAEADYLTLHLPVTSGTTGLFNAERLARCKRGVKIVNTARGDLIDEQALVDALRTGQVAAAALDVFQQEPPKDWTLPTLPNVIATPHIAASTGEAQELVGVETAAAVRDFLRDGIIRNAVNFPSLAPDEFTRLRPYLTLAERLGTLLAQMGEARTTGVGVRYYGALAEGRNNDLLASAVLVGLFRTMLSTSVTVVNAKPVAAARGIELVESRSSRTRDFTSLLSVKLHTSEGERWVEGTVFEHGGPRLVLVDGVPVEAPLEGNQIIIKNNDQPGVIGAVGTVLGRHGVNIANFALGRTPQCAIGVVGVDDGDKITAQVMEELRRIPAVHSAQLVRL